LYQAGLLAPGGTTAIVTPVSGSGAGGVDVVSLATGQVTQVLYKTVAPEADGGSDQVLAMDPAGTQLLVQAGSFGRLDGTVFTSLPVPADNQGSAYSAAW
jgi:hypothetical protein